MSSKTPPEFLHHSRTHPQSHHRTETHDCINVVQRQKKRTCRRSRWESRLLDRRCCNTSSHTHLSSCLTASAFSTHAKGSWLGLRVVSPSTQRTNVQAALQRTSGTGFVRTQVVSISTWAVASLTPADTSNTPRMARDGHGWPWHSDADAQAPAPGSSSSKEDRLASMKDGMIKSTD